MRKGQLACWSNSTAAASSRSPSSSSAAYVRRSVTGRLAAGARLPRAGRSPATSASRAVWRPPSTTSSPPRVPRHPSRRPGPRRAGSAGAPAEPARVAARAQVAPTTSAPACRTSPIPARSLAALTAPAWRETSSTQSATATHAERPTPRLARRLPSARPRCRGRPRARDRLHRLSPGAVAHLSLAGGQRHRSRGARRTGLARSTADRRTGGIGGDAVPVDAEGIDVARSAQSGTDAVVITPAHQFPTGAVLSSRRRAALIEWAEEGDRLIIEDDYDAELCRERIGSLQGLAPDRVLYIGSASKRLAPGMRLGWMLPPSWLSWALIIAKAIEDARLGDHRPACARGLHRTRRARTPSAPDAPALRTTPGDASRRARE